MKKRYATVAVIAALAIPLGVAEADSGSVTCEKSIPGLSLKVEKQLPKGYTVEASDESGRKVVCE